MSSFCRFCEHVFFYKILYSGRPFLVVQRHSSQFKVLEEKLVTRTKSFRTHTCGDLNAKHLKQSVSLCGWLEFQRMNCFAVLRDGYGSTQLIIPEERNDLADLLKNAPLESVVSVQGVVEKRPEKQIRQDSTTGEVEVVVSDLNIINPVRHTLPFNIRDHNKASENLRIKHRYLDLRYPAMQRNLRERSRFLMKMRNFLSEQENFVEVETPTLFKKTPGGAQEFIVPTKNPGEFFSLVQSPQQLKQLLMVGSLDRYFQVARCYRDEGSRPDRQPEFTQLDLEMSFCRENDVMDIIERLLVYSWPRPLRTPFPRITYAHAMRTYGTDQPDISFKCTISEVKSLLNGDMRDEKVFAVKIPQASVYFTSSLKNELKKQLKGSPARIEFLNYVDESCEKVKNALSRLGINAQHFIGELNIKPGDMVFVSKGKEKDALLGLGKCRVWYCRWLRGQGKTGPWENEAGRGHFLWLTDFPLFETSDSGGLQSVHHPFTSPHPDDMHLLDSHPLQWCEVCTPLEMRVLPLISFPQSVILYIPHLDPPLAVRSLHYDLVLDGYEVGGGSIRVHCPDLQAELLSRLQIPTAELGHLIEALASGAPPHGGIALGVDRLVSIMLGTNTIRDVIAFPKTADGRDPLSGAPSPVSPQDLKHYNVSVVKN